MMTIASLLGQVVLVGIVFFAVVGIFRAAMPFLDSPLTQEEIDELYK